MNKTKTITACGMICAICGAVMLLGQVLGIGMYASPMLAGLCLLPIGSLFGKKYHLLTFSAAALVSFMLVSDIEQNLMFLCIYGWYPALRDVLQKLKNPLRIIAKFCMFNVIVIPLEMLICLVLVPEALSAALWILLVVLFDLTFFLYDRLIPRAQNILEKYLKKILHLY